MLDRMMTTKGTATAALALLVLAGCGGEQSQPDADAPEDAEAAAEEVVDPAEAGTVRGTVSFTGAAPAAEPLDMSEEPECADAYGEDGPIRERVVVRDGGLGNVFVYVRDGLDREFPAPRTPVDLDQENCRYDPHVLGIQAGQPLKIINSDPVLHNVNTQPQRNRGFNISQPRAGMETTRQFAVPEVMIPVRCDVHGWMEAYIGVTGHPYYAVTGEDGSFELSNLPAGAYVLEAWHEAYGTQTANVTVVAGETAEAAFEYSADMAGAEVPLGEPLIVRWHAEDGPTAVRPSEMGAAGR